MVRGNSVLADAGTRLETSVLIGTLFAFDSAVCLGALALGAAVAIAGRTLVTFITDGRAGCCKSSCPVTCCSEAATVCGPFVIWRPITYATPTAAHNPKPHISAVV